MSIRGMIDHKAERAHRLNRLKHNAEVCRLAFKYPAAYRLQEAREEIDLLPIDWWPVVTVIIALALTIWHPGEIRWYHEIKSLTPLVKP